MARQRTYAKARGDDDEIEVTVIVVHETPQALMIKETEDQAKAISIPKSLVIDRVDNGFVTILTIPEWVALDRGLV